jgi:hypothetical protein
MYVSLLKLTMLLAAARQEPKDLKVRAEMRDLLSAAYYIQRWGKHAVDLIQNSGTTADESKLMAIYRTIEKHPGIQRSQVMQRHHMNARAMDVVEDTLVQRMMVTLEMRGKIKSYWPIGR